MSREDKRVVDHEIEEAKVPTSQRLVDAFGMDAEMTPTDFAKKLETLGERATLGVPLVRDMTKPVALAYQDMVLNYGAGSDEAQDLYKLLEKEMGKALAVAAKDPETLKMLKESPEFKDVSLDISPEKAAALVAAEMENQADLERGRLLADAKRKEGKGKGEHVASDEPVSPSDVPRKVAQRQPHGKGEYASKA